MSKKLRGLLYRHFRQPHWEGCADVHWDCRIAQLEAELAVLKSERRWIPVSERLPEDKQRVFIVTKSGNFSHTVFEKGYFAWEENIPFKELAIAYWMPMFELPLPPPPEEK